MNFLSGSKSSESPTVRSYKPVHSPFSVVVVLGTDEPQQWNFHPDHEDTPRFKNHTVVSFHDFTFPFFLHPFVLFFTFSLSPTRCPFLSPCLCPCLCPCFFLSPRSSSCCSSSSSLLNFNVVLIVSFPSGFTKRLLDTVVAAPQKAVCTRLVSSVRSRFYRRWQPMCLSTILLCGGVCSCAFFWIIPGISHHHVFLHA